MPSRAETRGRFEAALRVVSMGLIAFMLWQSLDHGRADHEANGKSSNLREDLRDWTQSGIAPARISVKLDSVPSARDRDWLSALRAAGSSVSWHGGLPAVGFDVQPIAAPSGGYRMVISAPAGASVVIADEIGPIDTISARNGGASVSVPSASGTITATSAGTSASAALPETLRIRRVLVIGDANWESKFVIAALEEDGWKVDARTHVAPGVTVTQGSIFPIDTTRYSAVVALDRSVGAYASGIVRFAGSGGGVIIGAAAAGLESLSPLRAGGAGRVDVPSSVTSEPGSVTLQSLSVVPVAAMKNDALVLERRGGSVAVAARRFGNGRVLQVGYLDTWRWRMSGGENSVGEHRKWWTSAVASVANAPVVRTTVSTGTDNAPVARLIESLGKPASTGKGPLVSTTASISLWWPFAILSLSLLAEWISRRTRGVR
ncbi:MAG TPA: hypothetical protein VM053_00610 [Gemmatimonadaceae bacterium]|nr:hypothetical protein [Gemmatimonadaceae bacterium]